MKHRLSPCTPHGIFTLLMLLCSVFASPANAQSQWADCSSNSSSEMLFANVIPWQPTSPINDTIWVDCTNTNRFWSIRVSVCLSIGTGSADNGTHWSPRRLSDNNGPSGNPLYFRILNANGGDFGSWYYGRSAVKLATFSIPGNSRVRRSVPVTLSLSPMQTTVSPGMYSSSFPVGHTGMSYESSIYFNPDCSNSAPDTPDSFHFNVRANVIPYCEITDGIADMDFGAADGILDSGKKASTQITVRCTNRTPYRIQLRPPNGNDNGEGQMTAVQSGTVIQPHTDTVPYRLFQDAGASTTPWGNLPHNSYAGTGTGVAQTVTVYGAVPPNLNVTPGRYQDRIIVTVTY